MGPSLNPPPSFLDLATEWAIKAFPTLRVKPPFGNLPLQVYLTEGRETPKWLVSIQFYESNHRACIWNFRLSADYIKWFDVADPDLFTKLESFINNTVKVANDPIS